MATVRKWLSELGFDWEKGTIVFQAVEDREGKAFWATGAEAEPGIPPGQAMPLEGRIVGRDDPFLDWEFNDRHGAPNCPRFIARDQKAIYFPATFAGATWAERIFLDLSQYVGAKGEFEHAPYLGD